MNSVLAAEMSLVSGVHLRAVQDAAPAPEGTPSDLLDTLMVAQDVLWKTLPQDGKPDKHDRRIILARSRLHRRPDRSRVPLACCGEDSVQTLQGSNML